MGLDIQIPITTAVIPTYGRVGIELTRECIASMVANHPNLTNIQKIVVLDNAKSDDSLLPDYRALCDSLGAELVALDDRGGFAKACNAGLRRSNGVVSFLVNNDVVFEMPTLQLLTQTCLETNSGVVGCRLLYENRTIQHGGVTYIPVKNPEVIDGVGEIRGYFDHIGRGQNEYSPYAAVLRQHCLVTGALYGINRSAISAVGLLDERYEFAVEDIDYSLECAVVGLTTTYNGYVSAIHKEGMTRGRTPEEKTKLDPQAWEMEKIGLAKFHSKWCDLELRRYTFQ